MSKSSTLHRIAGLGALSVALFFGSPVFSAQPAPPPKAEVGQTEKLDLDRLLDDGWCGLYMGKQKIGCIRIVAAKEIFSGKPAFSQTMTMTAKLTAAGNQVEMNFALSTIHSAEPPYELLETVLRQSAGGQEVVRRGVRKADVFEISSTVGGQTSVQKTNPPKSALADEAAATLLVFSKPDVGAERKCLHYDLERNADEPHLLRVKEIQPGVSGGLPIKIYRVELKNLVNGNAFDFMIEENGRMLSLVIGGLFEARREPEALAKDIKFSSDLFIGGMLKTDKPLGPPQKISALKLRLRGEQRGLNLIVTDGRQVVTKENGVALLDIVKGRPTTLKVTEDEIARALKPTLIINSDHPDVIAKAKEVVGDEKDFMKKIERLCRFVDQYLENEMVSGLDPASELLKKKVGDCTEHALLFVALARAVGLPARQVGGLMYTGDELQAFGWHAWAEVAKDGVWFPVDPAWNQMVLDASHIRVDAEDQAMGMLHLYGKVKAEVLDVK